jgi:fatty acid synthase, animal type
MGHAEAASGMASIAKILVALENRKFPPNINLDELRQDVPAFAEKRIKVATEVEELRGDYIAMNSFGLGGANQHALFKGNTKEKINQGIPSDALPRIVLWAGRTEEAINAIFDDICERPLDVEHLALLHNSQVQTTSANTYRGYGLFLHDHDVNKAVCFDRKIEYFSDSQRPIVFVYSGIGSQWLEMGKDLMRIPTFAEKIEKLSKILIDKNVNLKEVLLSSDENTFKDVLQSYIGIIATEIALTDILHDIGIKPDFIIGHSVGELGCAYADGCLSSEETILAAYARGTSHKESNTINGAMAAIGMSYLELEEILPHDIDIACHNGTESTTISGPAVSVKEFVEKLKEKGTFTKEVSCSGIPLHSRYITEMGQKLNEKLKQIIKSPKQRSKKWLSSTYPEEIWSTEETLFSSAEYHTKNLLNPVFFEEVVKLLPEKVLTIEIAPHGLLKSILKRTLKDGIYVSLTEKNNKDGVNFLLESIGR